MPLSFGQTRVARWPLRLLRPLLCGTLPVPAPPAARLLDRDGAVCRGADDDGVVLAPGALVARPLGDGGGVLLVRACAAPPEHVRAALTQLHERGWVVERTGVSA